MIPQIAVDVIGTMWPVLILCSVVLITLRITYLINNKKSFVLYKELISLSFVIYILLLFELVTTTDYYAFSNNFTPFKEMFRYSINSPLFLRNVIGNVILFLPFGYFIAYFCKINKFYIALLINAIISLTIEAIQSYIGRAFDIDDVILNVIGGFGGYIIYKLSEKILKKYNAKFKNSLILNLIFLMIMFALMLIILRVYEVI